MSIWCLFRDSVTPAVFRNAVLMATLQLFFLQVAVLLAVTVNASHIFILHVKTYAKTLSMPSLIYYIIVFKVLSHQSTVWALTWGKNELSQEV